MSEIINMGGEFYTVIIGEKSTGDYSGIVPTMPLFFDRLNMLLESNALTSSFLLYFNISVNFVEAFL